MSNVNKNTELSAPWLVYWRKLCALFENDDEIDIGELCDNSLTDGYYVGISVCSHKKFEALQQLLPARLVFGNVELTTYIYETLNDEEETDYRKLFTDLFDGNDIFDEFLTVIDHVGSKHDFAVFKPRALQFYSDDISDPYGNKTMLTQDVARDVFTDMVGDDVKFTSSLMKCGDGTSGGGNA